MTLTEITGLITPICGVAIAYFTYVNNKEIRRNTALTNQLQNTVDTVKTQTDGMNKVQMEMAAQIGESIGKEKGKEEQRLENERMRIDPFVVLLDDDKDDLRFQTDYLKKIGVQNILSFRDPDVFLNNLTERVNVYIIDLRLPKRSGLEIAIDVMKKNQNNFIIICTGESEQYIREQYHNKEIDYVLHKNSPNYEVDFKKYVLEGLSKVSLRK